MAHRDYDKYCKKRKNNGQDSYIWSTDDYQLII